MKSYGWGTKPLPCPQKGGGVRRLLVMTVMLPEPTEPLATPHQGGAGGGVVPHFDPQHFFVLIKTLLSLWNAPPQDIRLLLTWDATDSLGRVTSHQSECSSSEDDPRAEDSRRHKCSSTVLSNVGCHVTFSLHFAYKNGPPSCSVGMFSISWEPCGENQRLVAVFNTYIIGFKPVG